VFLRSSPTGFLAGNMFPIGGTNPTSVAVGDFNGDGRLDIATANFASNSVSMLLGDGAGGFGAATAVGAGFNKPIAVVAARLNADGRTDLAVANEGSEQLSILLAGGAAGQAFAISAPVKVGESPFAIAAADITNDGAIDLLVVNAQSNDVSILIGDGSGRFIERSRVKTGARPLGITVGDFNRDGRPDFAVTNGLSDNVQVFVGDGSGGFNLGRELKAGAQPRGIATADFDGDGTLDLAVFEGVQSGILGEDDVAQSASLVEPGNAVGLLLYENTWAGPFVAALRREGADVIASGRIPAADVIAVLDELEAAESTGSA